MDITQLIITCVAIVGTLIVGLLAIVPTLLEIPHDHDAPHDPGHPAPTPLRPRDNGRPNGHDDSHRLAA
jgi:hypothetical protein